MLVYTDNRAVVLHIGVPGRGDSKPATARLRNSLCEIFSISMWVKTTKVTKFCVKIKKNRLLLIDLSNFVLYMVCNDCKTYKNGSKM